MQLIVHLLSMDSSIMKQQYRAVWLLGLIFLAGCTTFYPSGKVQYTQYSVGAENSVDSALVSLLSPYTREVKRTMEQFVVQVDTDLEKKQPEGTLGNLMADAMLTMAEKEYGIRPDAAFMNYGGIRLNVIKAGPLTVGKIYELFPFDNLLVLLRLKGAVLQQFLDHIAARGGWPVAGMTMQIAQRKAVNVYIGGVPLDPEKIYTIAVGDYTANGGDDAAMLKGIPQINKGYLMRDAFIAYFSSFAKEGKTIHLSPENRVTYAQ